MPMYRQSKLTSHFWSKQTLQIPVLNHLCCWYTIELNYGRCFNVLYNIFALLPVLYLEFLKLYPLYTAVNRDTPYRGSHPSYANSSDFDKFRLKFRILKQLVIEKHTAHNLTVPSLKAKLLCILGTRLTWATEEQTGPTGPLQICLGSVSSHLPFPVYSVISFVLYSS
jgi:hypothetical protein